MFWKAAYHLITDPSLPVTLSAPLPVTVPSLRHGRRLLRTWIHQQVSALTLILISYFNIARMSITCLDFKAELEHTELSSQTYEPHNIDKAQANLWSHLQAFNHGPHRPSFPARGAENSYFVEERVQKEQATSNIDLSSEGFNMHRIKGSSQPQRATSLGWFRENRKERCFDKNIRYNVQKKVTLRYYGYLSL
ncbi:hypothetical protein E3N88_10142 [Mikania micrantha]|uniref:Uncharacterized protein n=1 Tax=Mikania micrantha TaxID=192012 RepID=A0A5N6P9N1_9ASTR|nr:hypothetical protein E3N88_10142 [Mikania micrantha]